jgi:hypothetical protein
MEHSRRADLREQLYRAFITRASEGERNNLGLLERILKLRQEKAAILGYRSFADVSLASKMAPGVLAVDKLLTELRSAARPRAKKELDELTEYARSKRAILRRSSPCGTSLFGPNACAKSGMPIATKSCAPISRFRGSWTGSSRRLSASSRSR